MPDMTHALPPAALDAVLDRVASLVAPLWPLRDFVAVNPFLGLAGLPFAEAAATLRTLQGTELLPPRAFARAALAEGRLGAADLAEAGADPALLHETRPSPTPEPLLVTDVLDATLGTAWGAFALEEISRWAAAWADEGQAAWAMPWRDLPLHAAWRAAMRHDRAAEVAGLRGFRAALRALPAAPRDCIAACLAQLGLDAAAAGPYLHRALLSVSGWAALLRQRGWPAATDEVLELLAVRVAWDATLHALHEAPAFRAAWAARLAAPPRPQPDMSGDLALLEAMEAAHRRRLAAALAAPAPARPAPEAQAIFCIDVRSEPFRRALEEVAPAVETLGFAGFFGVALDWMPFGEDRAVLQAPVLLQPSLLVCEGVAGAGPAGTERALAAHGLRRKVRDTWDNLRASAVSCFAYVETAGFAAAAGLLRGALNRPAEEAPLARLLPAIAPGEWRGRPAGLSTEGRIAAAESMLRAMSFTGGFGGLVLLVGHGARTVNNPHAAGLDCGACGGHSGERNARVAAAILNDPLVREGLRARGIAVPADTWFLAALHETVTDTVRILDAERIPPSQQALLDRLSDRLEEAGRLARDRRAPGLGIPEEADPHADLARRSRDWSEVRPEWALAGNAAFVAAPRARTLGADLQGRAFLHSYDWRADQGFGTLELILTAPLVVASWINLQYFASTVDNAAWGSGNKALHNVAARLGVLEGVGGDLRAGLPWQSVHDGTRFRHEPLRLQAVVEAPEAEMDRVIARHPHLRDLVENGWLRLHSMEDSGALRLRHAAGDWRPLG
ncbi:YbcC family protein [Roseococcus sp. DSY-14]|uniref:YbcC family protein n=1 Tax=Roseococcus sp. DSY-14 TaxID=3369650 RepID=UPI00387AA4AD